MTSASEELSYEARADWPTSSTSSIRRAADERSEEKASAIAPRAAPASEELSYEQAARPSWPRWCSKLESGGGTLEESLAPLGARRAPGRRLPALARRRQGQPRRRRLSPPRAPDHPTCRHLASQLFKSRGPCERLPEAATAGQSSRQVGSAAGGEADGDEGEGGADEGAQVGAAGGGGQDGSMTTAPMIWPAIMPRPSRRTPMRCTTAAATAMKTMPSSPPK